MPTLSISARKANSIPYFQNTFFKYVNVASRICSHAKPNEVLIGANTYAYVQDGMTAQALSPLRFKGKSQEITVYQITDIAENTLIETLKNIPSP